MKKMLPMLLIFLAMILLVGCISIPLGDGEKLTIGFDGINIETDRSENEGDSKSNNLTESEEIESNQIDQNNENDQAGAESNDLEENTDVEENLNECQEDTGTLLERVPPNFPIPD